MFAASLPMVDEISKATRDGVDGYFVSNAGLKAMRRSFELKLGDAYEALAKEQALRWLSDQAVDAYRKGVKGLELRANLGLPLGIGLGWASALAVFGIVFGILKATLPAQIQAAQ